MKLCIVNGPPLVAQRHGRPDYNRYHPSRKRLLKSGRRVGRKSKQRKTK